MAIHNDTDPSDPQLLGLWHKGDVTAFERLLHRHESALLRHARVFVAGGRDAEDIVQETFIKLAQNPPDVRPEAGALAAWLHRVARNLATDQLRSEARRRKREEIAAAAEATRGGLDRVEADDTRAAVARSIERLPEDQREVLTLRLFGERSYSEIAAITGIKSGTVGWLLSVGMKALADELGPRLPASQAAPAG